jgi:hypothetical protein
MPDCFISYSSYDRNLANFVYRQIKLQGLSPFLAAISLKPGQRWTEVILNNLRQSSWVILLASKKACASHYVLQEIGGALLTNKKIIPIVWDQPPSRLPGLLNSIHAIDLRGCNTTDLAIHLSKISKSIRAEKTNGAIIASALIAGLLYFATKK